MAHCKTEGLLCDKRFTVSERQESVTIMRKEFRSRRNLISIDVDYLVVTMLTTPSWC